LPLHHFALQKRQPDGDIEFVITIKEYVNPPYPMMKFLAQADIAPSVSAGMAFPEDVGFREP
jgi:hypothetical protein